MFDSIKDSLNKQKSGDSNYRDIMKTEIDNTYIVRLVPNVAAPDRTFHHYFHHSWTSLSTGQFVTGICPTTWGDRCPICEHRMKLYRGSEADKKRAGELKRKENWLVNAYVITDPKVKENNGMLKILRYGKQIKEILDEAMEGEDAAEFGAAIFDLTANGCSLRLKVEKNEGGYPTYVKSKFLSKGEIEGMTEDKINQLQSGLFQLDKVFPTKTYDQIVEMLNDHFLCLSKKSSTPSPIPSPKLETKVDESDSSDNEPADKTPSISSSNITPTGKSDLDNKLDDILKDLK